MCGIAGTLDFGAARTDEATLERMIRAIGHRGPDGIRVERSHAAGLAHARLRVIDLSPQADQPMWNEDRSVAVLFNGEIYNFLELRSELERKGRRFRTRSDTEVILRLYEVEGEDAIPRLDGMFALAIWDRRKGTLQLARDRAGKKPLYYYRDGGRFVFGSEIKALHAHPDVARRPNIDALPYYLTYGYFPAPATAHEGIRVLPPATRMSIDACGNTRSHRYWTPPYRANGLRSETEALFTVREKLDRAVARRLISDVPLGAFLSGGIDSTLVVGLMSRHLRQPVRTFSIGFESAADFDETHYAELAAKTFGTDHTTFRVEPPGADLFETLVHHHDGPFGDSSAIPTYIVSRLAREHVTVVLNGDGGDELFAGYSRLAAAAWAERIPWTLRRGGHLVARALPEPSSWSHPMRRLKRLLEAASLPLEERIQAWCSFFPHPSRALLDGGNGQDERAIREHFASFLREAEGGTPLAKLLYLNFCTYLPEDLLVKMDRSTMAHGLEARSPFLDTELIELAGKLPDRLKLRGLTTKYVLREAFRDVIPAPILRRGKMGFGVPLGAWFRDPLRPYVMDHLASSEARLFQFLRPEPVREYLDDHMSSRRDLGHQLFCLLTLEIWLRSF